MRLRHVSSRSGHAPCTYVPAIFVESPDLWLVSVSFMRAIPIVCFVVKNYVELIHIFVVVFYWSNPRKRFKAF